MNDELLSIFPNLAAELRVLVADPDPDFRAACAARLSESGLEMTGCDSAEQAIEALAREPFAVAVIHRGLPDLVAMPLDGDLLRRLMQACNQSDRCVQLVRRAAADGPQWDMVDTGETLPVVLTDSGLDAVVVQVHHAARLRATARYAEAEIRFRQLMDAANDAILISDAATGRIVDANARARQLVGYALPDLQQMHQQETHPEEERAAFRQQFAEHNQNRHGLVTVLHVLHRSGRRIPVEISCSEIGSPGRPLVQTILRNVTERMRSEQALRMSDERFRQLTENIDEVFWLIEWKTLAAIYVSPAYEIIWGRSHESALGSLDGPVSFIHPDDAARVRDAFRCDAPDGRFDEEFRIVRPDGGIRWIRQRAFPIYNASGELYRIAAVADDVTERRLVQDELRKRNHELAHLARLSTMGELVAELAHEINQPLYAISNYAEACSNVLQSRPAELEAFLQQWTGQIALQAKRAGEIIRRISRFLRKDAPELAPVDINLLIRGTLGLLEFELKGKQVAVRLDLAENIPRVLVTSLHIEQVLVNLLRNAIDALTSRPNQRTVTVSTRALHGERLEVAIADNGQGIASADSDRLFEPFFTTKPDGLGLGLAICQTTVRSYGGSMEFSQAPGGGAIFRFTLPSAQRTEPN